MKVIEKMIELKNEGILDLWVKENNSYEYLYGLYGDSSIENPEYIKNNQKILNSEVKDFYKITDKIARIIY